MGTANYRHRESIVRAKPSRRQSLRGKCSQGVSAELNRAINCNVFRYYHQISFALQCLTFMFIATSVYPPIRYLKNNWHLEFLLSKRVLSVSIINHAYVYFYREYLNIQQNVLTILSCNNI